MKRATILLVLNLTFLVSRISAQTGTSIVGIVLDADSHTPIPLATVSVLGTGFITSADQLGRFQFEFIPSGEYQLQASVIGFNSKLSPEIKVAIDRIQTVQFYLTRNPIKLPEIIVSGKSSVNFGKISGSEIILSREEIRRSDAADIGEAISHLPGVYVMRAGPSGATRVSLRGSGTDQVLVLVDGIRINSVQTGEADLGAIPLSSVERIEVFKGAESIRFGADALAGAVNIVTRVWESDPFKNLSLTQVMGSFGSRMTEFQMKYPLHALLNAFLTHRQSGSEGDFPYPDSGKTKTRVNSGKTGENTFFSLNWNKQDRSQAGLTLFQYFGNSGLPGPLLELNDSAYSKDHRTNLALSASHRFNRNISWESKIGHQDWKQTFHMFEEYRIPADVDNYNLQYEFDSRVNWNANGSGVSLGVANLTSSLGSDDRLRPTLSIQKEKRNTFSAFVLTQHKLRQQFLDLASLSGALRFDNTGGYYRQWSPQVGFTLSHGKELNIKFCGNWGKSFNHPSLNSLFWKEDTYAAGNPDLRPERATNLDAGLEFRAVWLGEIQAGMVCFSNTVYDLIVWQRRFDGKYTPSNVSRAEIEGYEQYLRWGEANNTVQLEFSHTRADAVNRTEIHTRYGQLIPFRPRHQYNLKIYVKTRGMDWSLQSNSVSKRFLREQNTPQKILAAYTVWDLCLKLKPSLGKVRFTISGSINNLTDEHYELLERFPMPGREYRFSLQAEI
ncbi:MAG: TonB-dependent receptor [candidate division Zixibacteria bacterium]|nr:TonB-dependent receptor [candidate division Zixibacteria bacterium]